MWEVSGWKRRIVSFLFFCHFPLTLNSSGKGFPPLIVNIAEEEGEIERKKLSVANQQKESFFFTVLWRRWEEIYKEESSSCLSAPMGPYPTAGVAATATMVLPGSMAPNGLG